MSCRRRDLLQNLHVRLWTLRPTSCGLLQYRQTIVWRSSGVGMLMSPSAMRADYSCPLATEAASPRIEGCTRYLLGWFCGTAGGSALLPVPAPAPAPAPPCC